ncbi:exonuclease domain-containing protein [Amycolatopsis umgeniensis]|uniref:DNA polymerase-3 subunit epsilon n=1 Tax=Amycolatopsis umgeniensis TaxID=336628 RepID=A0A841B6X4_9PSEU|nr:3'-5' exonuclease [Amycolatopsis umgeniensis]MBB5854288.1 DNA polymerase-3 subunit epsilon [Amycolatopsis umgeniensis]
MAETVENLVLTGDGRFAVGTTEFTAIDFETTGLHPGHVVEVAAVRVRADGTVLREFSTLVNPGRGVDPGPAHVHRITRRELDNAPYLGEVLGDFLDLCQGSVLVAHNLPFEARFLGGEFGRLGARVPAMPGVCTLAAARRSLRLPNYRLATVAEAVGVGEFAAHTALADAYVCARIVTTLVTTHGLRFATRPVFPELPRFAPAARLSPRRAVVPSGGTWMADFVDRVPEAAFGVPGSLRDAYVELLGNALADRHISDTEARALGSAASAAGMSDADLHRVHTGFVRAMRELAESDGVITTEEGRDLRTVAAALRVPEVLHGLQAAATSSGGRRRVLVLGDGLAEDGLRAAVLDAGLQLAKKLTASVTHLVVGSGVSPAEPRIARAGELGARVLGIAEASQVLGLVPQPSPAPVRIPEPIPVPAPAAHWPAYDSDRRTAVFAPPPQSPAPSVMLWGGRVLMGFGLLLMFITVLALFGGAGLAAGIFVGVLGVGGLLGGWQIAVRG